MTAAAVTTKRLTGCPAQGADFSCPATYVPSVPVFLRISQEAPGKGSASPVFATLPPRDQRVAAIRAEIGKLPAAAYQTSDELARVQAEVKALAPPPAPIKK